jgi:nucleoside-diphosphate-sugar epimerase
VADGIEVRALCRYTSRRDPGNLIDIPDDVFDAIDVRYGDLLDSDHVRRLADGVDVIYHLGASISVPYSYVAPREVARTNFEGTLNVLEAARESESRRVVQLSSSEVYGTAQYAPIDEAHPLHAQSPYAASKVGADKLAETYHLSFGLPVVIARPFNTFGPRQSKRAVIPTIVSQAIAGDVVEIGALDTSRDFVFVADTVDALVRLAADDGPAGETFNVSTGADVSVATVIDLVGDLLGRQLEVKVRDDRLRPPTSEVYRLIGTAEKLTAATGWQARTGIQEGLRAVVEWWSNRPVGTRSDLYIV